jgi:hypothetical protein
VRWPRVHARRHLLSSGVEARATVKVRRRARVRHARRYHDEVEVLDDLLLALLA